jgi:hypothetical protein
MRWPPVRWRAPRAVLKVWVLGVCEFSLGHSIHGKCLLSRPPTITPLMEGGLQISQHIRFRVKLAPAGTQGAQLDIKAAYRCIPCTFDHLPFLAVGKYNGGQPPVEVWLDFNFPFGCRSSGGNLGMALDATLDILQKKLNLPLIAKWVDDIVPIRTPSSTMNGIHNYSVSFDDFAHEIRAFGWPIADDKNRDFAPTVLFIGFSWDFVNKVVSLPELKREKFLKRTQDWLTRSNSGGVSQSETEKVVGSLEHVCSVHQHGRSFLSPAYAFLKSFSSVSRFVTRHPPRDVVADMRTWTSILAIPHASRSLSHRPTIDIDIWVDACTSWGIAIVVGPLWRAWKLKAGWKSNRRDIGWAESAAIELAALEICARGYRNCVVIVHSDNQGSIGQFWKGRGRNPESNLCIRRATEACMHHLIDIQPSYVCSAENRADAPSRGRELHPEYKLHHSFETPEAFRDLLSDVI